MKKSQIATYINIFIILGVAAWCSAAFIPPKPHLRDTKAPVPNAFDDLETADKLLVEDPAIYPDRKMPHVGDPGYMDSFLQGVSVAHQDKIITENAPALQDLRVALSQEYLSPQITSLEQMLPYDARYRQMARLLSFEGKVAASRGDWQTTTSNSLDTIALGYKIQRGAPLIQVLTGFSMNTIGRANAWYAIDHVSGEIARESARRLESIYATRTSSDQLWAQEESAVEAILVEVMAHPERAYPNQKDWLPSWYFLIIPKWKMMDDYRSAMTDLEQKSIQPYQLVKNNDFTRGRADIFVNLMLPEDRQALIKNTIDQTFTQMLMTLFALRSYEVDHEGAYPDRIIQLVPRYLSKVPSDPFAANLGPLQYRRVGKSYLLYSVGPDGIDDGGKPFLGTDTHGRPSRVYMQEDTKGDIVAGVNMD